MPHVRPIYNQSSPCYFLRPFLHVPCGVEKRPGDGVWRVIRHLSKQDDEGCSTNSWIESNNFPTFYYPAATVAAYVSYLSHPVILSSPNISHRQVRGPWAWLRHAPSSAGSPTSSTTHAHDAVLVAESRTLCSVVGSGCHAFCSTVPSCLDTCTWCRHLSGMHLVVLCFPPLALFTCPWCVVQ